MHKFRKIYTIAIIFLILGSGFYWYEMRPNSIRKECHEIAVNGAQKIFKTKVELINRHRQYYEKVSEKDFYFKDDYKSYFEGCLNKRGLLR